MKDKSKNIILRSITLSLVIICVFSLSIEQLVFFIDDTVVEMIVDFESPGEKESQTADEKEVEYKIISLPGKQGYKAEMASSPSYLYNDEWNSVFLSVPTPPPDQKTSYTTLTFMRKLVWPRTEDALHSQTKDCFL